MATTPRSLPKGSKSDLRTLSDLISSAPQAQAGTTVTTDQYFLLPAETRNRVLELIAVLDKRETKRRRATKKTPAKSARKAR